eukprot:6535667-Prymnesium_polylepis.1
MAAHRERSTHDWAAAAPGSTPSVEPIGPCRSASRLLSARAVREARQRALELERLAASPLALKPLRRPLPPEV